jgi:phosphoglycerate kinase
MSANIHTYNFTGKRALIRVDFNVPLDENGKVTDDTRMRAVVPTINQVLNGGGSVVLMSHLGRPKGEEDAFSLKQIVDHLSGLLNHKVIFAGNCIGEKATELTSNLAPGEVVLLENLRFHKEETAGDEFFAGQLAEHGDVYINDAFGTAHRAHASTAIIARFFAHDKLFGFVMEGEIKAIDKVLHGAEPPVTAIIGGAKVSSKLTIIENLIPKVDRILIGGGMAFTFIKSRGGKIGSSLVEEDLMEDARRVEKKAEEGGVKLYLPSDSVIADAFDNNANTKILDRLGCRTRNNKDI